MALLSMYKYLLEAFFINSKIWSYLQLINTFFMKYNKFISFSLVFGKKKRVSTWTLSTTFYPINPSIFQILC